MQSAYAAFVIAQSQKYRPNCMSSTRTCYVTNNVALPDFDTHVSIPKYRDWWAAQFRDFWIEKQAQSYLIGSRKSS